MATRKRTKEELLNQAEWFLGYAKENWKLGDKTEKEISKILWLNEDEKKGFLERLSSKFWKELDISDKWEIEKTLKKKRIDFEKIWGEYIKYLSIKSKEKHDREKVERLFESYKTPDDKVNEKIINIIIENYSEDILEKVRLFLERKCLEVFLDKKAFEYYVLWSMINFDDLQFMLNYFNMGELEIIRKTPCTIKKINDSWEEEYIHYDVSKYDIDTIKENTFFLKKSWFNYKNFNLNELKDKNIKKYVEIINNCNLEWFRRGFEEDEENDELKNIFFQFKDLEKSDLLKYCIKCWPYYIDKVLSKSPNIHYENNVWYTSKLVHMFWRDCDNNKLMREYLWWSDFDFLAYLWTIYWTNNWKKNIDLAFEKWLIKWKDILPEYEDFNSDIAYLKLIDNNILDLLVKRWVVKEDFKKLMNIVASLDYENLNFVLGKYENITVKELISLKEVLTTHDILWRLKMIFENYPKVTINELWMLDDIIAKVSDVKLNFVFEKYKIDDSKKFAYLKDLWEVLKDSKIEHLKIIFKQYPEITPAELNQLKTLLSYTNSEELEVIFEQYPEIDIKELHSMEAILSFANRKTFVQIFLYFSPIKINEIYNYAKICKFWWIIPEDIKFKENNRKWYLKYINEIVDMCYDRDKKFKMMKKIVSLTFEQAQNYLVVFQMFDNSISMDIQRVKNELIDEILDCENPEKTVETIINIFERNNLPLTWKIFKVFELLYPKEKIKSTLQPHWSPVLHKYLDEWKNVYSLIYVDLMNIAIKSWDRSLKNYINTFIWAEKVLKKFESIINHPWFNPDNKLCLEWKLEEREQEQLLYLFRKCSVLYNRYYWKDVKEWDLIEDKTLWISNISDDQLVKFYNDIKEWFHLKKWESIYDRLQRFLWWLWYHSFEEVLDKMNESKKTAHQRGLKLYNESNWWKIDFPEQAFLKWVDESAFSQIINRWITCREYLWWWENGNAAWSDCTPFDIDWWYTNSFLEWGYGNVKIVINTKNGNIYDSREEWVEWYTRGKYELFKTWACWEKHYGIRTWVPTSEVDYIIYTWKFDSKDFETICYEIARNGYYIPITDKDWKIKFTPEMYHRIRVWFNYMEYYDWFDVQEIGWKYISKENDNEIHRDANDVDMVKLIAENSPKNEKYRNFAKENRELAENTIEWIKEILEEKCWIKFNSKFDSSITWAELHDSWSTWRWTDIPTKDVDLDFTLILDAQDYERVVEISKVIHEEIWTQKDDDHWVSEWWNQIKSKINNIWKSEERPNGVPLDLLILKKSQVIDYSSSDAMKEKLEYIASNPNSWVEDLDRVRANVIIMKKLLKAKWCYKKPEWWIAWIWVENRIIQNHWNFIEALESFEQVAYGWKYEKWKQPLSLQEFQMSYPIFDAGENYKDWCNDNFIYKLQESWYQWTLEIIKIYRLEWINWIRKLIKEYEQKKWEFI